LRQSTYFELLGIESGQGVYVLHMIKKKTLKEGKL